MSLQFPNITPDFINVSLPGYIQNKQQFTTSDFYIINYQQNFGNVILDCKIKQFSKSQINTVVDFYHLAKHQFFVIPSVFLKRFPSTFISNLKFYNFWEFDSNIQISPQVVNNSHFIAETNFRIKNVLI